MCVCVCVCACVCVFVCLRLNAVIGLALRTEVNIQEERIFERLGTFGHLSGQEAVTHTQLKWHLSYKTHSVLQWLKKSLLHDGASLL